MKGKKWVLIRHFSGLPKESDLELVDEEINDDIEEKEILLEALYWSVDPYMRPYSERYEARPMDMFGEQLARVIKSRNDEFPVGTLVLAQTGWRSHFISKGDNLKPIPFDLGDTLESYCLGALGMPGATAYMGLYKLCEPKAGEIVIVNGGAGAVGSTVGQLAKIRGCTVIALLVLMIKLIGAKMNLDLIMFSITRK